MKYRTVKQYAQELLVRVNYVDAFRRNVGLDYRAILVLLKREFPKSNTTVKELQKIAYSMNGANVRLPVRRRSRRILARDFARALLLFKDEAGQGLSYQVIASRVKARFPDINLFGGDRRDRRLGSTAGHLSKSGVKLPNRPPNRVKK